MGTGFIDWWVLVDPVVGEKVNKNNSLRVQSLALAVVAGGRSTLVSMG